MIDPSDHINLLWHVIRQLGIPAYLADEAFSEGLISLTKAAKMYDAQKGVPEAAWLARYIRWDLLIWRKREMPRQSQELPEKLLSPRTPVHLEAEQRILLQEVTVALEQMTPRERLVIVGEAYDLSLVDLSRRLRMFGPDLIQFQRESRVKLSNIIAAQRILKGQLPQRKERTNMAKTPKAEAEETAVAEAPPVAAPKAATTAKPKAAATPKAAPKVVEKVACSGTTRAGTPCPMPVVKGTNTCYNHVSAEYRAEHPRPVRQAGTGTPSGGGKLAALEAQVAALAARVEALENFTNVSVSNGATAPIIAEEYAPPAVAEAPVEGVVKVNGKPTAKSQERIAAARGQTPAPAATAPKRRGSQA